MWADQSVDSAIYAIMYQQVVMALWLGSYRTDRVVIEW